MDDVMLEGMLIFVFARGQHHAVQVLLSDNKRIMMYFFAFHLGSKLSVWMVTCAVMYVNQRVF